MMTAVPWSRFVLPYLVLLSFVALATPSVTQADQLCGNGIVEGVEECDDGYDNSDSSPDACRTDCRVARCGDYTRDSNEECDEGPLNSDELPNGCRKDCRLAYCGDGVVDLGARVAEYCEDGNDNPYDGCHNCQVCVPLKDDLTISNSQLISPTQGTVVTICPGSYEIEDRGKEGIVQVTGSDLVINAKDVYLKGKPRDFSQLSAGAVNPAMAQLNPGGSSSRSDKTNKLLANLPALRKNAATDNGNTNRNTPSGPTTAGAPNGTGFVVTGNNVVIQNASLEGFRTGINLKSSGNALYNNDLCKNSRGVVAGNGHNFGVNNACKNSQNWQENGQAGCRSACN